MDGACENSTVAGPTAQGYDLLSNFLLLLAILATTDHLLIKPWVCAKVQKATDVETARWFFVHALANAMVCMTAANSMRAVALDPLHAFDGASFTDDDTGLFGIGSKWPLLAINATVTTWWADSASRPPTTFTMAYSSLRLHSQVNSPETPLDASHDTSQAHLSAKAHSAHF